MQTKRKVRPAGICLGKSGSLIFQRFLQSFRNRFLSLPCWHYVFVFIIFGFRTSTSLSQAQILTSQLTLRASTTFVDSGSLLEDGDGSTTLYDGTVNLRLMTQPSSGPHTLSLHYEISGVGGDFYRQKQSLGSLGSSSGTKNERSNLFNLRHTLSTSSSLRTEHRLDRLSYQYYADWGTITVGRDVVTWGNGLVFNPLDLLNPFSPEDIERDYKVGEDMLLFDLYPADWNQDLAWQLLFVPRRDPTTGNIEADNASFAAKTHFFINESEWDLMLAMHYNEPHFGIGSVHTLGGAVVRTDLLVGVPESGDRRYSAIINIDYSWTLAGMNAYGLLEYCYQSLGEEEILQALNSEPLLQRISRGEVYTYGKHYLSGALQIELHPLLHAHCSTILNLGDGSCIIQPHLTWDPYQNLQIAAGAQLSLGPENTEFGGYQLSSALPEFDPPNTVFIWLKWYL